MLITGTLVVLQPKVVGGGGGAPLLEKSVAAAQAQYQLRRHSVIGAGL